MDWFQQKLQTNLERVVEQLPEGVQANLQEIKSSVQDLQGALKSKLATVLPSESDSKDLERGASPGGAGSSGPRNHETTDTGLATGRAAATDSKGLGGTGTVAGTAASSSMGKRDERRAGQMAKHFVRVAADGTHLQVKDSPFVFVGANCPSLATMAATPGTKRQVCALLDAARNAGLTVLRLHAFADGAGGLLQPAPGEYNEEGYRGLDFVLHEAAARQLRLVLVLTNYWQEGGGMRQYRRWSCQRRGVDEDDSPDKFYSDERCQDIFQASIVKLVDRTNTLNGALYREDPTILAWSLANAPRCAGDYSGSKLQDWAASTAEFVKSMDSNHLVTMDMEGLLGASSADRVKENPPGLSAMDLGVDFFRQFTEEHLDFASMQCWPDEWLPESDEEGLLRFAERWVGVHAELAQELGKPLYISAFGKKPAGPERAVFFSRVFQQLLEHARGSGLAGAMFSVAVVPGWEPHVDHPEYHVHLDVPEPRAVVAGLGGRRSSSAAQRAHSIRSLRSDDCGLESSDDEPGEEAAAKSKATGDGANTSAAAAAARSRAASTAVSPDRPSSPVSTAASPKATDAEAAAAAAAAAMGKKKAPAVTAADDYETLCVIRDAAAGAAQLCKGHKADCSIM